MKAINKIEDFEFVKKNEFLDKYLTSKEYSDLIKYLEIETWNRIGTNFLYNKKNNKKNKVSETTLTENIVYLLTMISEEYGISDIELYEDWTERESGADLKLQFEIFGKYLEIPVQCKKIDFKSTEYKSFNHPVNVYEKNIAYKTLSTNRKVEINNRNKKRYVKCNQFDLILNEVKNNAKHVLGLYFFYNSLEKSKMNNFKIRENEEYHFYGISYLDIESLKSISKYDFESINTPTRGYPLHYLFNLYDDHKKELQSDKYLSDDEKNDRLNSFLGHIKNAKSDVHHEDVLISELSGNEDNLLKHKKRILTIRVKNNSIKENTDKKNMKFFLKKETYLYTISFELPSKNELKKEEYCFDWIERIK